MILNGIINFPSSQILYLVAGYFVSTNNLLFIPALVAGALGNTIGNFIAYKLTYKYGKPIVKKILYVREATLDHMHQEFSNKGIWWLFFGKLIPSVKTLVPAIAGLAKIGQHKSLAIFFFGSTVWATLILYIGYTFGEHITLKGYAATMSVVGILLLFFAYKKFIKK